MQRKPLIHDNKTDVTCQGPMSLHAKHGGLDFLNMSICLVGSLLPFCENCASPSLGSCLFPLGKKKSGSSFAS